MNLLIVDDDLLVANGIKKAVSEAGLVSKCYTAGGMADAIATFREHKINIMITDIEMAGGSGLELIKYLRDHEMFSTNIILSSYPDFKYAQQAIILGVCEYLLKPVTEEELFSSIKKAVAKLLESPRGEFEEADSMFVESEFMATVKKYVSDNISTEINRRELAAHLGFSEAYMIRRFKKEADCTLNEYIKNVRIKLAKTLLCQSNLPISDIAENTGFSTVAYFSSTFRMSENMTPREFRNANKS